MPEKPGTCPIPVCLLCARKTMVSAGQMVPGLMEWTVLWRWPALIMWLPTQVKTHICGQDQEGGEPRVPSAYNNGKRGKCDLSWACWGSSHDNEPRTAHSRGRCGLLHIQIMQIFLQIKVKSPNYRKFNNWHFNTHEYVKY